jgi:hypothetical protein
MSCGDFYQPRPQQGWECPRCHRINAPFVAQCTCEPRDFQPFAPYEPSKTAPARTNTPYWYTTEQPVITFTNDGNTYQYRIRSGVRYYPAQNWEPVV